jgi:cation transport regulator ChaC
VTAVPGAKVLLVEDEPNLARGIRENLVHEGYDVDLVGDGPTALTKMRAQDYAVVVLDVMLPGLDGFTVCETARREGNDTPVLFLTAKGGAHDRIRGLEAGGECHGMAFRLAASSVLPIFETLWRREMATGAYHPSWIKCQTPQGPVKALAFVIDRTGPAYVPEPPEDALIEIVLRASGIYGSCLEYVTQTADALEAVGIHDARLSALVARLKDQLNQQRHSLS